MPSGQQGARDTDMKFYESVNRGHRVLKKKMEEMELSTRGGRI